MSGTEHEGREQQGPQPDPTGQDPAGRDPDGRDPDDDGGPYGVFGEGRPRHIVGDSDEPPRRRPRTRPSS